MRADDGRAGRSPERVPPGSVGLPLAAGVDLPESGAPCACGRSHGVAIDEVAISPDALEHLVAYAGRRGWEGALVVMDANTEEVLGAEAAAALRGAGLAVSVVRFAERSGLLADEDAVARVRGALGAGARGAVVAVGSGTLTDIARYSAGAEGRPFVVLATAPSMDGYASGVAAMQFGGVKVSSPAPPPRAVFADPAVLAGAPAEMTVWGLGDLLGKATARVDWLLASGLYGEPFCPAVEERVLSPLTYAAAHAPEAVQGRPEAVGRLFGGLVESGVAMSMMGSSRPASGCEHHASHLWDLLAFRGRREHAPHGLQVGYATRFAMRLQRFALGGAAGASPPPPPPAREGGDREDAATWLGEALGPLAVVEEQKERWMRDRAAAWPDASRWAALRRACTEAMALFPAVERALDVAGIPDGPGFIGVDPGMLQATFRHARRLRARYTTLDFLAGQGLLEEAVASL